MYGTITNTTIFGTYDIGVAVSKTTFANGADSSNNLAIPGCPKLEYIELGTVEYDETSWYKYACMRYL